MKPIPAGCPTFARNPNNVAITNPDAGKCGKHHRLFIPV